MRASGDPAVIGTPHRRRRDEVRASFATAGGVRSTIDEYVQANASIQEAASLRDFAESPWSSSQPAADTMPPGPPRRTTWPPCRPTASAASSPALPILR